MTEPIRIHASDDSEAVRSRHADIEKRLDDIGRDGVHAMLATGGLPTNWNPIIHAWLAGKKLEQKADV